MKKLVLVLSAALISVTSFAQLGIYGGLTSTSSNISTAMTELSTKMISQYHAGLCYKIPLGNIFALQPGIEYNVKGANLNEFKLSAMDFKTGYIEVPVQVQAGVGLGKIIRLYGIVEPFVGYAVSNTVTKDDTTQNTWENVKNRFEWGIGAGAGVEFIDRIQLNLKYFWNFGPIYGADNQITELTGLSNTYCGGICLSAVVLLF